MESKKRNLSAELATGRHTAVYARDGAVQLGQSSLEAQVDACVCQAAEDGAPPVGAAYVFRDRQSGAELDRPGLNRLRRVVQAAEVGVLYVRSLDRLSCNSRHLLALRWEFASAGVELRFLWHPSASSTAQWTSPIAVMFRMAADGWSISDIAILANVLDFPRLRGGRWTATSIKELLEKGTTRRNRDGRQT